MHDTADGIDSNGHESSSLMNPGFVCERWMDSSDGERHLEPSVQPTTAYNGGSVMSGSVMIWTGMSLNGRSALVVVPGNLNGRRYIDEILPPHVVPYLRQMGQNAIFQDNDARPHHARIVDSVCN